MNIAADIRLALRSLRRNPLFASVAILSLALGIGANTAIFTLLDQILLRKLPVKDPESLVMLYQRGPHNGSNMGDRMQSYPIYQDWQKKAAPLAEVLCRRLIDVSITNGGQTERIGAELVSGNYFTMLGVGAAAGRVFSSEADDRVYGGHPVAVISHDYWRTRFQSDPAVVGRKVLINNYPFTIAGVSAEGFAGLDPANSPQIRVPILMKSAMLPEWTFLEMADRRTRWVQVFARLKPGYTAETANPALQVLYRQIREYEATLPAASTWSKFSRDRFLAGTIHVENAATGYSGLRNSFSKSLIVLMCMVGLVLLIACANVANLLIARAFARQKEIAIRLSLGATRGQLVRQLLVESVLLALAGGALGVFLAAALTKGLLAMIPFEGSPLLISPEPDLRILALTLALTLATGIGFGLLPALRASRPDLWSTLKDTVGSIAGAGGSLYLRKGLVAAQVALSFLLLFGAGLFVRSLENLQKMETGFRDIDNLVTFQVAPGLNGYDDARSAQFYRDLRERLNATPGVRSAALASVPVLHGWEWDSSLSVEGHQAKDGEDMQGYMNSLSPGYFDTMGIALLEGRDFDDRDPNEKATVAIVNRRFAEHYFKGKSAVGRRIGIGSRPGTQLRIEIVGVVANTLYEGPKEGLHRQVYIPHFGNRGVAFYVRAARDSESIFRAVRAAVKGLDPSLPVYEMKTLGGQLDQTLLTERLIALLSAGFGGLATLLAAIGLYGVMAFVVTRRTKEMGVRMALGASAVDVTWLILREVLALLALGLALGVPAAMGLSQYVSTQLFEVAPRDPWLAVSVSAILIVVALAAGLVPARRAARIDPMLALRFE